MKTNKKGFTQVPNEIVNNKELTLAEKGALLIFLSNKTNWKTYKKEFETRSYIGRDATSGVFDSLFSKGYIAKVKLTDEEDRLKKAGTGRFVKCDTYFKLTELGSLGQQLETRNRKPELVNQLNETSVALSATNNTNTNNTNIDNTKKEKINQEKKGVSVYEEPELENQPADELEFSYSEEYIQMMSAFTERENCFLEPDMQELETVKEEVEIPTPTHFSSKNKSKGKFDGISINETNEESFKSYVLDFFLKEDLEEEGLGFLVWKAQYSYRDKNGDIEKSWKPYIEFTIKEVLAGKQGYVRHLTPSTPQTETSHSSEINTPTPFYLKKEMEFEKPKVERRKLPAQVYQNDQWDEIQRLVTLIEEKTNESSEKVQELLEEWIPKIQLNCVQSAMAQFRNRPSIALEELVSVYEKYYEMKQKTNLHI